MILKRSSVAKDFITGNQDYVGLRVPSHSKALALITEFKKLGGHGVAAPSANRFGGVSPTSVEHVKEELGAYLDDSDRIIDGGECEEGVESTIIDCSRQLPRILRLGAVTEEMIKSVVAIDQDDDIEEIRASGTLSRHYSPKAKVVTDRMAKAGEGLIALANIETPAGVHRLASPGTIENYARELYGALRRADSSGLNVVVVTPPSGDGLAAAIRDRISRASASE